MIAAGVIVVIVLVAIFAPVFAAITGHGVNQQFYAPVGLTADGQPLGPSSHFLLGTDDPGPRPAGADRLRRADLAASSGCSRRSSRWPSAPPSGLLAGYLGGLVDTILARLMDLLLAIPYLLLAISLVIRARAGADRWSSS